jgi:hypothetical protein
MLDNSKEARPIYTGQAPKELFNPAKNHFTD